MAERMPIFRLSRKAPETKPTRVGPVEQPRSPASASRANLAVTPSRNETAARLWQLMEGKDITPKELAVLLCNEYEVGEEDALKDVEKQLCEWKQSGLVG